jgi:murein DD-endopeptidase MepM/ murein hydrolase activator NlpD
VDFAAATGTPIYAAGDGVISYRGRKGGYGKYIRIRHAGGFNTAYAHMSRFKKKVNLGTRVRQGQVIGYVGTTGRSTGPHLHYEILAGGRQVNPLTVKMPSGIKLGKKSFARFMAKRANTDALVANLQKETLISQR